MTRPKFLHRIMLLATAVTLLVSCSPGPAQPAAPAATAPPAATAAPVVIVVTSPPTPTVQLYLDNPTENKTGKTIISRASRDTRFQTTYMIISKSGTVIVADPYQMVEGVKADIIISTHKDYDHNDAEFYAANDCRKSLYTVEKFSVKDVTVTSFASTHWPNAAIDPANPSNVIYVFDVDGLRIAHMGDTWEDSLTPEQLQALGHVDIVFTIMEDQPYYGYTKEKTLTILKQLNPSVVMPIHPEQAALEAVGQSVDETLEATIRWAVSKDDLKDGKRRLVLLSPYPATP